MTDSSGRTRDLEISGLASGGRGVGRSEGKVWFVAGAVPGELVRARSVQERPRWIRAEAERILRPSAARRQAACPIQGECPGCPWMILEEAEQRTWKARLVEDALVRLGGLENPTLEPTREVSSPTGYRGRVELTLGSNAAGLPLLGLRSSATDGGVCDVDYCLVQHETANDVLASIRSFLQGRGAGEAEIGSPGRDPHRVMIRRSTSSGEVIVALREVERPFPCAVELARHVTRRHPEVVGVVRVQARPGRRGGPRLEALSGRSWIEERIGDETFHLPVTTFTQVNAEGGEALVREVVQRAGGVRGARVLDLYGGVGAFGLPLARRGASVEVWDADRDAVRCGRETARRARIADIRYVHVDVRARLGARGEPGPRASVIVANPPRTGLGPHVVRGIIGARPRRILMVSCDPATLARDARALVDGGYALERAIPFDLFPQTAHVETLAVFDRLSGDGEAKRPRPRPESPPRPGSDSR